MAIWSHHHPSWFHPGPISLIQSLEEILNESHEFTFRLSMAVPLCKGESAFTHSTNFRSKIFRSEFNCTRPSFCGAARASTCCRNSTLPQQDHLSWWQLVDAARYVALGTGPKMEDSKPHGFAEESVTFNALPVGLEQGAT